MKTAVLHAFFGGVPPWWDIYILSAGSNPSLDFYYFTDLDLPTHGFPNIKVVTMTFKEVIKKASKVLGFAVQINTPYKLCDLKPAYGRIFAEWLAPYDFWAHADVDVFYGDIRCWLTDKLLARHDIVSCRKHIISGQFTAYRNCEQINELYMQIPGFQDLVNSPKSNYVDDKWLSGVVKDSVARGSLRFYGEDTLVEDCLSEIRGRSRLYLNFRDGRITDVVFRREYFMFHFYRSKKRDAFIRSLRPVIESGGRFYFFQDRLVAKTEGNQWRRLVEVLQADFRYNLKRFIKSFILRWDSSNY
jgi:hypothetical protein